MLFLFYHYNISRINLSPILCISKYLTKMVVSKDMKYFSYNPIFELLCFMDRMTEINPTL